MPAFPDDIFTEPADVDPDTLANLGPLRRLAGTWEGPKGHDINPKADGPEHRDYIEHMLFEPIDPQANGPQLFYGLRYHTRINTPEEDIAFHDQVGRPPGSSCRRCRSRAAKWRSPADMRRRATTNSC